MAGSCVVTAAILWIGLRIAQESMSATCRAALRDEDWSRLERSARLWRMFDRRHAAPLVYLSEVAIQKGQYETAVSLIERLPDGDPMTPAALLECSSIQFGPLNRPIDGAATLERAIRLDPYLPEAHRRLIYFYAFTLQRQKLAHAAREAIKAGCDLPETYIYLISRDWLAFANAFDENSKWLRDDPDRELFLVARAIYRIATKALDDDERIIQEESKIPFHRKVVAEYLDRFPKNLELLAYHLKTNSKDGEPDAVAHYLSLAPPEAAEDGRFWRYKGWLHSARGELSQAREAYLKALSLNCYDPESQHQLAGVARRLRLPKEAQRYQVLASEGKQLQREILQSDSVASVSRSVLWRIANYARDCGDQEVAQHLLHRLEQAADGPWFGPPQGTAGAPIPQAMPGTLDRGDLPPPTPKLPQQRSPKSEPSQ